MARDNDRPDGEGRGLILTLERLRGRLSKLPPDRQAELKRRLEADTVPETPSEFLRSVIIRRGLTAYRVGKLSGASIDAVHRFLRGDTGLRGDTLDKICVALGLELVEREPETNGGEHERAGAVPAVGPGRGRADRNDAGGEGSGDQGVRDRVHG